MSKISMTLEEIHELAKTCFLANGCNEENAAALANTVFTAERDGSESHGLFRIPGYVKSLRSGKVNGHANPSAEHVTPAVIRLDADNGYAPLAIQRGIPLLAEATKAIGMGAMAIHNTYHFAALWPEVEALAEHGLVGMACTAYKPRVAPAGAKKALMGTNPMAFAWPRPGHPPFVFDMATAGKSMGEIQIAARDGHEVPLGTGLDAEGNDTTDPNKIVKGGALLPFGGYKGSAISLMVELLAGGMTGERFSFEAQKLDVPDGGPPRGGEFIMAMSPALVAGADWEEHCESFFATLHGMEGVRVPGQRRHKNRLSDAPRNVNAALIETIKGLVDSAEA